MEYEVVKWEVRSGSDKLTDSIGSVQRAGRLLRSI